MHMPPQTSGLEADWREEGFDLWSATGSFERSIARFFFREGDTSILFRLEVTKDQCNGAGTVHGGFLSTLADEWMAINVARLLPVGARFVTASLAIDFLNPALPGDVLESAIDRIKTGRRLCFASGAILHAGAPVAAVRASFAMLEMRQAVRG